MAAEETVAGSVSAITLLSRHIRETNTLIENAVDEVCQSFDSTARLSQLNFERTTNFLGQGSAQRDDANLAELIASSERVLHHLLDRLGEASQKSRSAIQRLNQIDERISRVAYSMTQINDITTANRLLAVNARIQAAQLGKQGAGFGVVADEITMQAKLSSQFSSTIETLIAQLREAVSLSREDLMDTASHDQEAVEESKREVVRKHTEFRQFLDRTQTFLTDAAADSRKVTNDIHSSVRGLQFQDRASQRLEFIAKELDRIAAGEGHLGLADMMTRTSMVEQREPAASVCAGEVELF